MAETIHQGRNIKRFREMLGLKQEGLAYELGDDWNQKKVSLLEQKEVVDDVLLEQVAKVLKVPKEAIKKFDEQAAVNIITNTINNHDNSSVYGTYHFSPLDEWKESVAENKKLQDENRNLYERLLQVEREKNELLQRLLSEKDK